MARLYLASALANVWVLMAILLAAFVDQFASGEPPCPLCVMQRIAMVLAALGPCHMLLAADRAALTARDIAVGCGMAVLGSVLGAAISIRQILLHILPGDPGFGSPVLGYHLYTWALVAFACNLVAAGVQLAGLAWFQPPPRRIGVLARTTAMLLLLLLGANILSVIAEAGFAWKLPDNPTSYLLFQRG
ncbi:MAG: disulfide bond formation protein B [Acetobacteraceae bacterium]